MESEKPLNAFCNPMKATKVNRNTGHGNRRRTASGNVVRASATNTEVLGTTFTMPKYCRMAKSGITMEDAASMSWPHPIRNAIAATAASTPQSFGVIARLFTRKLSMPSWYAPDTASAIHQQRYFESPPKPRAQRAVPPRAPSRPRSGRAPAVLLACNRRRGS